MHDDNRQLKIQKTLISSEAVVMRLRHFAFLFDKNCAVSAFNHMQMK